jgi:hypothetical protein
MAAFLGWWLLLVRHRTKKKSEQARFAGADQRTVQNG